MGQCGFHIDLGRKLQLQSVNVNYRIQAKGPQNSHLKLGGLIKGTELDEAYAWHGLIADVELSAYVCDYR